jgi:preprotein translocase subunit SecA
MDIARILDSVVARFIGTKHERDLKKLQPIVVAINAQEPEVQALSDEQLNERFETPILRTTRIKTSCRLRWMRSPYLRLRWFAKLAAAS